MVRNCLAEKREELNRATIKATDRSFFWGMWLFVTSDLLKIHDRILLSASMTRSKSRAVMEGYIGRERICS